MSNGLAFILCMTMVLVCLLLAAGLGIWGTVVSIIFAVLFFLVALVFVLMAGTA